MRQPWFVYILESEKDGSFYVGSTYDLDWRLRRHNDGWSQSTKARRPWMVVYVEGYATKHEALARELSVKRMKSRKYIERLFAGGRPDAASNPDLPFASLMPSEYIHGITTMSSREQVDHPILIATQRLSLGGLEQFRNAPFENMIKFVVDARLRKIALGGEMHADAEEKLLEAGSNQSDIWGGNLWPWEQPPRIEYISLINIRPSAENRGMDILRDDIRTAVRDIVHQWIALR